MKTTELAKYLSIIGAYLEQLARPAGEILLRINGRDEQPAEALANRISHLREAMTAAKRLAEGSKRDDVRLKEVVASVERLNKYLGRIGMYLDPIEPAMIDEINRVMMECCANCIAGIEEASAYVVAAAEAPVTQTEAATISGADKSTIAKWVKAGKLETVGVARHKLITRASLDRAMAGELKPKKQKKKMWANAEKWKKANNL